MALRQWFAVACVGLLAVAGLWGVSQLSISALLSADAAQRLQQYHSGSSPYVWSMRSPDELVGRTVHSNTPWQFTEQGLHIRVGPDGVSVPLHLHGERIDSDVLDTLRITLRSTSDAHVTALLDDGLRDTLTPQAESAAQSDAQTISMTLPRGLISRQLTLFFSAPDNSDVTVRSVALLSERCSAPPCVPAVSTLALAVRPELLLAQRDIERQDAPQSLWRSPLPDVDAWVALIQLVESVWWTLPLLTALLAAGIVWRRSEPGTPRRHQTELLAVLGPIGVALLLGWPNDTNLYGNLALPMLCLGTAWLLGDPEPRRMVLIGGRDAWRAYLPTTLVLGGSLAVVALLNDAARWPSMTDGLRYLFWSAVQQLLLIRFIAPRLASGTRSTPMLGLACGVVFADLHLPNFSLSVLTLIAGVWWGIAGHRHRTLLPAVVAHTVLGLMLIAALPPQWLRSAEVGARFVFAPQ